MTFKKIFSFSSEEEPNIPLKGFLFITVPKFTMPCLHNFIKQLIKLKELGHSCIDLYVLYGIVDFEYDRINTLVNGTKLSIQTTLPVL